MELAISHTTAQKYLRQRNLFGLALAVCVVLLVVLFSVAMTRDREIILQPVATRPLTLNSSGVDRDYLEMVTRDTALLALNRSPETLTYWMDNLLRISDPASRGELKRELMKVVQEQSGTQISQFFTIDTMTVNPASLTSEVTGILHTVAGSKEVTAVPKRFRFTWSYSGVSLKLRGFGIVEKADKPEGK